MAPPPLLLTAQFTKRDAILYSLGIGCFSDNGDGSIDDISSENAFGDDELRFVFERHKDFESFPTFLLALSFLADRRNPDEAGTAASCPASGSRIGSGIRPFPPDSMSDPSDREGGVGGYRGCLIPRMFFRDPSEALQTKNLPVLHISQSLTLHRKFPIYPPFLRGGDSTSMDPPMQLHLEIRVTSVQPKRIGTFVSTRTCYFELNENGVRCDVATAEMTALVLGVDPNLVIPWQSQMNVGAKLDKSESEQSAALSKGLNNTRRNIRQHESSAPMRMDNNRLRRNKSTTWQYRIPRNAALLYRLSGDYNPIHVEDSGDDSLAGWMSSDDNKNRKNIPVLHGLCTMGYAVRAVLKHANGKYGGKDNVSLTFVRCNFSKPVFIGDVIRVSVWDAKEDSNTNTNAMNLTSSRDCILHFCVFRVPKNLSNVPIGNQTGDEKSDIVVDKGLATVRWESSVSRL